MLYRMQKESFHFDKMLGFESEYLLKKCEGILREFGEIPGKYRILDGKPVGSKGLI